MARRDVRFRIVVACLAVDAVVVFVMTAFGVGSVPARVAVLVSLVSAGCVAARLGVRR